MDRPIQSGEASGFVARFAKPGDRNRFVLDVRALGTESIRVEVAGDLKLRVRASAGLRADALALLFAHGGHVLADVLHPSHRETLGRS